MRRPLAAFALAAAALTLAVAQAPVAAQRGGVRADSGSTADLQALRQRAEARFQVVEVRNGLILVPKFDAAGARTIDLDDGRVLLDGTAVTGRELRDRMGEDADLVLRLSFLDADGRRAFFAAAAPGAPAAAAPPAPPVAVPAPPVPPAPPDPDRREWQESGRYRHGGARVRVGGDVEVGEDEAVTDDVVVVLGSARVDGLVEGSVVAVGGSIVLGPKARVQGDVTAVGGGIERSSGAVIEGESHEVRFSGPHLGPLFRARPWKAWHWSGGPFEGVSGGSVDLLSTLVRIGLVALFAALIAAVAPGAVRRVADRAAAEPWRAGLVGLAAELLFVPLLVLTVAILAISIIGIPLLLLVPFGLIAVAGAFLMGLAGTGCALGTWVGRRSGGGAPGLLASLVIGLAVVWALTVVARFAGLAGMPVRVIVSVVLLAGFLVEYVAWTVGIGAVVLTRFGRRGTALAVPDEAR